MSVFVDYEGLKILGKQFIEALPTAKSDEVEQGFKCFALAYLNCELKNKHEEVSAPILMQIISRKMIEHRCIELDRTVI